MVGPERVRVTIPGCDPADGQSRLRRSAGRDGDHGQSRLCGGLGEIEQAEQEGQHTLGAEVGIGDPIPAAAVTDAREHLVQKRLKLAHVNGEPQPHRNKGGSGSYFCSQCGPGSGLRMIQKHRGWDFPTAAREVDKIIGYGPPRPYAAPREPDRDQLHQKLVTILEEANSPSLVAGYLRGRGLRTVPKVLRGHKALPYVADGAFLGRYRVVIASLIEICKLNAVDPQAYLADVLSRLINRHSASQIDQLMPWAYTPTNRVA
jgi:hypothetical protein